MAFNLKLVNSYGGAGSTTLNGTSHTTGSGIVGGEALLLADVTPGTLDAYVDMTAKTNTMTLAVLWQVSDDNSTWKDVLPAGQTSTTNLVLATGTGSAVEKKCCVSAPPSIHAHRYARICVQVGVADSGDASDAWAYSYNYVKKDFD